MTNFSKILTGATICAISTGAFAHGGFAQQEQYAPAGFVIGADIGYGYLNAPEALYPNNFSLPIGDRGIVYDYSSNYDIGHWVWGAHVGYDFKVVSNFLFGFELGYKDFGESKMNNLLGSMVPEMEWVSFARKYEQSAFDFLLTAHYYPWKGLNFFGKVGAAYMRSHITQNSDSNAPFIDNITLGNIVGSMLDGNHTTWRLEPEFALGVGYTFAKHVDVHASYIHTASSAPESFSPNYFSELSSSFGVPGTFTEKTRVYSTNSVMAGISYTF